MMLYRYGFSLGMKLLRSGRVKQSLRYLVVPVNYWRTLEFRLAYAAAEFRRGDRILDIGSPKLLSLFLADRHDVEVYATDIEDYFVDEYDMLRRVRNVPTERLHVAVEDGRRLTFDDNHFTKVYSISVLEHIPENGDTECAKEIGRVLAPGGRCVITVPFNAASKQEYKRPNFYWHGSSNGTHDGKVFYQRRYSERDLFQRIIEPSGLALKDLKYVGEHLSISAEREVCDFLPRPTGPLQPVLSKLLHTAPVDRWQALKKPLCALIVLEKPIAA